MEPIEIKETKYKCRHCNRLFNSPADCLVHEDFCQSAEPAREFAKRFSDLLAFAAQHGITVMSEYVLKNVGYAEFNESMGEVHLMPSREECG